MISFEIKSQLAKLLATEDITMIHDPSASTASFDVKNRVLRLPVWKDISEDLYDMLVVHEVGHALDTPADGWIDTIKKLAEKYYPDSPAIVRASASNVIKDYMNIIEDARIDKRQKRRYPGSIRNYVAAYKELYARDFFGVAGQDPNALGFIDRMNLVFKGGAFLGIKFSAEEQVFIDRAATTETFEQVMELTEDVFAYSLNKGDIIESKTADCTVILVGEDGEDGEGAEGGENVDPSDVMTNEDSPGASGESEEDKEGKEGKEDNGSGEKKEEEKEGKKGGSKGQGTGETGDEKERSTKGNSSSQSKATYENKNNEGENSGSVRGSGAGDSRQKDFIPESKTAQAERTNIREMVDVSNDTYVYLDLPTFNYDAFVDDWRTVYKQVSEQCVNIGVWGKSNSSFTKWKNSEKDTVNFMVKEFETRKAADTYSRISIAKTGVINTNKIHSYKYNDDIFRKHAVVPEGKSHGLVILLDWSGSMSARLKDTLSQLFSIVFFCKRLQIPFDVYTFRSPVSAVDGDMYTQKRTWNSERNKSVVVFNDFKMRNILSSEMSPLQLNNMMLYIWTMERRNSYFDPMNSTPLNQALCVFSETVNRFKKKTKVQIVNTIVITDGESDPSGKSTSNLLDGNKKTYYIIRDPITKKFYLPMQKNNTVGPRDVPYGTHPTAQRNYFTNNMLRILKDRTQTTLIGFFLLSRLKGAAYTLGDAFVNDPKNIAQWKEKKFLSVKHVGYDEYFVTNVYDTGSVGKLDISSTDSKRKIAKVFSTHVAKKKTNRLMLTAFIDRISKEMF